MKKVVLILAAAALLAVLAGCDIAGLEESLERAEDRIENAVENRVDNASDAALSQEEAEEIALEHAGLSREQVQNLHSSYDYDDGIRQYDVDFREGDWEYEYEINADTGSVLSYDKDSVWD